jgi:hypothetical protein
VNLKIDAMIISLTNFGFIMLHRFLAFFCVTLITSPIGVADSASSRLQVSRVNSATGKDIVYSPQKARQSSIGGIPLGATVKQVLRQLGQPNRKEMGMNCGFETIALSYPDIEVLFFTDKETPKVFRVETSSPRYRTNKGIRVGDSIEKAQSADPSLSLDAVSAGGVYRNWRSFKTQFGLTVNSRGKIIEILMGINSDC